MSHLIVELQRYTAFIQSLVTIGAILITSYAAVKGLNTWRKQLLGGATMEVSRSVLRAVFRVRNAILSIRSPFFSEEEIVASAQTPLQKEGKINYYKLWSERWKLVDEMLPDLRTASIEAESLWGTHAKELIDKLHKLIFEFSIDLEHYLTITNFSHHKAPCDDPNHQELYCIVYGPSTKSQPDTFKDKLNSIVYDIECYVRNKMMDRPVKEPRRQHIK